MKYYPPPLSEEIPQNQKITHKNETEKTPKKKIVKKNRLQKRLKANKTLRKKKKKKFNSKSHTLKSKNQPLSKKTHTKKTSSPLKKFARKISFLPKKTNAFVTQSPDFDANSVKNRLFFLGSFFVGVGNVLINHFFFFFQLYDNSFFSSISSIFWDFIMNTFKLYDTFWSLLMSLVGSTKNTIKGRQKYGRYFTLMRMTAYSFCTYTHLTVWIYICRNFPFVKHFFWLPGLTPERWSYQIVNRLMYYIINKNLRQTLIQTCQDKYDENVNWTAQKFIDFGLYFVGLRTEKFFKDADPTSEPPESIENLKMRANRKRKWDQSFFGKMFSSDTTNAEKRQRKESSVVLQELSKAINNIKQTDSPSWGAQMILTPNEPSAVALYNGIDNLYYQLKTKFSILGLNFRNSFEKFTLPYVGNPETKQKLLLYIISGVQALGKQNGWDTSSFPVVGPLLENYKKQLLNKGLYFKKTDQGYVLDDHGFEDKDLEVGFLQEDI